MVPTKLGNLPHFIQVSLQQSHCLDQLFLERITQSSLVCLLIAQSVTWARGQIESDTDKVAPGLKPVLVS